MLLMLMLLVLLLLVLLLLLLCRCQHARAGACLLARACMAHSCDALGVGALQGSRA